MTRPANLLPVLLFLAACASRAEGTTTAGEPIVVGEPAAPGPPAPSSAPSAPVGAPPAEEEGPLLAGRRTFRGMVRPVKGGYEVRAVVLGGTSLPDALAKSAIDGIPSDSQWFVGAIVRVTAEIVAHDSEPPRKGGLVAQGREGTWLGASSVEIAELVTKPMQIEGKVQRSKGFFQVGDYLVTRDDLGWSLAGSNGAVEGDRVRLWGQPTIVHCEPNAQCLTGGSLPIFAVGRAEKLP